MTEHVSITIYDPVSHFVAIRRAFMTTFVVVTIIGTGWFLSSAAMQWAGFALLCVVAIGYVSAQKKYTPQQAADYLRDKYGVRAR
jgi:hypothetical protein